MTEPLQKIAFLVDRYRNAQAGTERQIHLLVAGLLERGCEVRMGVLRDSPYLQSGTFPAPVDVLGVRSIRSPSSWLRVLQWGRRLAAEGFATVQTFFDDSAVLGPWPLRLAGLRVIGSRRDMGYWYSRPGVLPLLRLSGPALSALVANSEAAGRHACASERIAASKLTVVYNALSPHPIAANAAEPEPPPAAARVGIVANVRPIKRVEDLVEAFIRIAERFPQADLAVVGGGNHSALIDRLERHGLGTRAHFPGQLSDPARWIETFSIGVLCSESEGLSNAIMEYMLAGKPVVATNTGGNPELVQHERTGYLVEVGDVEGLANALATLLADSALAHRLGAAGRAQVLHRFSAEAMIDAHLNVHCAVANGSRGVSAPVPRRTSW